MGERFGPKKSFYSVIRTVIGFGKTVYIILFFFKQHFLKFVKKTFSDPFSEVWLKTFQRC